MRIPTGALLGALLLLATAACGPDQAHEADGDGTSGPDPATVEIRVSWVPPSTPEEYQNGESLTLSADEIVHQQGQADPTTEPMDPGRWEEFVADLPEELSGIDDEESPCVGAGATLLTVEGAGDLDREVSASVCGGRTPPAADRIDALVADFR